MKVKPLYFVAVVASVVSMRQSSAQTQSCTLQGPPGQPGIPGTSGTPGIPGTPGTLAPSGCSSGVVRERRWKQCAWTFDQGKDHKDSGQVHECEFLKQKTDSYLRVVYMGNLRIRSCTDCCRRWYFTFKGAECKIPAPIDGALFHKVNINIHRPSNIEGYCGGIAAGKVRVGFNLGNCSGGNLKTGDAMTGWNQSSRIIIEEVEPPVA